MTSTPPRTTPAASNESATVFRSAYVVELGIRPKLASGFRLWRAVHHNDIARELEAAVAHDPGPGGIHVDWGFLLLELANARRAQAARHDNLYFAESLR